MKIVRAFVLASLTDIIIDSDRGVVAVMFVVLLVVVFVVLAVVAVAKAFTRSSSTPVLFKSL